jgi:hypothetical protein
MRKQNILYKKESCRTKKEKFCRDIACYAVTIFAAVMGFLFVSANASLVEAEADAADTGILATQHLK